MPRLYLYDFIEKKDAENNPLHLAFIDLNKAYGTVPREIIVINAMKMFNES